jgi:hypothetical protein
MNPEFGPLPPLAADFPQRVLRQVKRQRRRSATLRFGLGLGASVAALVLIVRPGHVIPKSPMSRAVVTDELGDVEISDALESDDGDPGAYFFPDSQVESQPAADESASDLPTGLEGTEE